MLLKAAGQHVDAAGDAGTAVTAGSKGHGRRGHQRNSRASFNDVGFHMKLRCQIERDGMLSHWLIGWRPDSLIPARQNRQPFFR